jgi:hypothetical protein
MIFRVKGGLYSPGNSGCEFTTSKLAISGYADVNRKYRFFIPHNSLSSEIHQLGDSFAERP